MGPPERRRKFGFGFKLKVVEFAKRTNNCAASREFGVSEKLVRDWRKIEETIKEMPRKKCAIRSGICMWKTLEDHVEKWILENLQNGYAVSRNSIRIYARNWAKAHPDFGKDFLGSASWCTRFMNRKGLLLRERTRIAQKLPEEPDAKITSFHSLVIGLRKQHNFPVSQIGIMDESLVNFAMLSNNTVDVKGVKTVLLRSTGQEKTTEFTVVLSCMADGTKLKPMVIFKRKLMPKINFPPGVFVHVHPKGWMDENGVMLWIEKVWNQRPGGLRKEHSLLVWDMSRSHQTANINKHLQKSNTKIAVIPRGLTSVLQPLDVSLSKPFKDSIRDQWNNWITEGDKTFTRSGSIRTASLDILCNFVLNAWESVKTETVIKSFKKCGISNSMDSMEDDVLWQDNNDDGDLPDCHGAAAEFIKDIAIPSSSEGDPFVDTLVCEVLMYMSDDEDEEFLGF